LKNTAPNPSGIARGRLPHPQLTGYSGCQNTLDCRWPWLVVSCSLKHFLWGNVLGLAILLCAAVVQGTLPAQNQPIIHASQRFEHETGGLLAIASNGTIYVVATVTSPRGGDDFDIVIHRLDPSGTVIGTTSLGGTGVDSAWSIALDASNNVHIVGVTYSTDFPLVNAFQTNGVAQYGMGFVTKLSPDCQTILYSSYIGAGDQTRVSTIAVDSVGAAWIAGATSSTNFPVTDDAFQIQPPEGIFGGNAFYSRISASGELLYSTYLGGTEWDSATCLTLDDNGNVYVFGYTYSFDFPTTVDNNFPPGVIPFYSRPFVSKFSAEGQMLFSMTFGGTGGDYPQVGTVDDQGNIYVAGNTSSKDFPTTNAFQSTLAVHTNYYSSDGFLVKIDPSGQFVYSTFLGGSLSDDIRSLVADSAGSLCRRHLR
jgi:hypothetical protein